MPAVTAPQKIGRSLALRYGDKNGNWDPTAPVRIANFVLGYDVDTRSSILNERMLDVVRPVEDFWDPQQNVAELEIVDKSAGSRLGMGLGQWLVREPNGRLRVVSHNALLGKHLPAEPEKPFIQDLEDLVKKHGMDVAIKTPAFVIATYLSRSWELFDQVYKARLHWGEAGDTGV